MKKLLLLTSVLALAACGGGSGGGSGAVATNGAEDFVRSGFISDATNTSNSKVTSMTSAVVVAKDGSGSAIRSATMTHNGKEYTVYELNDVKLHLADIAAEDGYLKIGVDKDGRIDKMTMVLGEDSDGSPIGGSIARVSDNNARFNGPVFEYVKDKYAKANGTEFEAADDDEMRAAIAIQYGFSGGAWEQQTGGEWKYIKSGEAQEHDGHEVVIQDTSDDLENAVRVALNFQEQGKWVDAGGKRKYIEYGDDAEYRVAATDSVTKDTLDNIVTNARLSALGHWNRVDEVMDVVSLGKDIDGQGTSLQYADFGHFNPVYKEKLVDLANKSGSTWVAAIEKTHSDSEVEAALQSEDYQLFAGGYAISGTTLKDTLDAPVNTTFKGKAIGRVYVSFQSNGVNRDSYLAEWNVPHDDGDHYSQDAGHDIAKTFTTTNATMTIDANGKQTLNMPFADFYTVKVEKNGNNPASYTFNGTPNDLQYRKNDNPGETEAAFKPGYYGVNTATEAAGTVYYATEQGIGTGADVGKISREWEFQAAYGMKKQ